MHLTRKLAEGTLWGGIFFLLFIVSFEQLISIPSWLKVAGRMHPMFLHFPIVMLLISFISIWIPAREEKMNEWLQAFRLLAALSAVVTAIMGILLSLEEDRSGAALQWHKWSGTCVALLGFIFYTWYPFFRKHKITGRALTLGAGGVIILTGHWGASLTHGDNYLLAPLTIEHKVPVTQAVIYPHVIKPVLQSKCIGCHSTDNAKGGLIMDNINGMLAGGKTGPLFVAGKPEMSLLLRRVHLPLDDKKHMPPKSKTQLTDDEIALLNAWVRSGALLDKKLVSLPVQDSFRVLASITLGMEPVSPDQPVYTFAAADPAKIAALNNNFRVLEQPGTGTPALNVHFYGKEMYSSKALEELMPINQQITELSLARMPVKDNDLSFVKQLPNLTKLNLNYSDVTARGLEQLTSLKNLQQLSLSGTAVNKAVLEKLLVLPQLKQVFIWNTSVDSSQLKSLSTKFKKVRLETGFFDNGENKIPLTPPMIKLPGGVIKEIVHVEMKHPYRGVEIRYTVDGTKPDSINSPKYTSPISIDTTTILIARAFKDGWYGSYESSTTYIKKGITPDSIELVSAPDPKYKKVGVKILTDGDIGDQNIGSGQWMGFQKNDAVLNLYFKEAVTIRHVLLNLLKNTGAYIFPPTKTEIWGGPDKSQMKLLAAVTTKKIMKNEPAAVFLQRLYFKPTKVKVLKIVAHHLKPIPKWHEGKGKNAWVFLNEIVVD